MSDHRFSYKFVLQVGDSLLRFGMTTSFGGIGGERSGDSQKKFKLEVVCESPLLSPI